MQQIRRSQMASDAMSSGATPASSCTIGSLAWCQAMVSRNAWNNTYENSSASPSVGPGNETSAHMLWEDNGGMHHTATDPKGFRELHTSGLSHFMFFLQQCASYPYTEPAAFLGAAGESVVHQTAQGGHHGRMVLPLEVTTEEPVYVNAKQYHGILRRRQLRAKAELENKVVKNRKPYLHESRHLHAMRRARDGGGRFVNTKKSDSTSNTTPCSSNSSEANKYSDSHGSEASGMQGADQYVQWGYEYQHFKVMKDWAAVSVMAAGFMNWLLPFIFSGNSFLANTS
nr:nuclear transcription factor Y subunit A-7-like isoform X1 [Ipomoea trifida]